MENDADRAYNEALQAISRIHTNLEELNRSFVKLWEEYYRLQYRLKERLSKRTDGK
jgi:hypothetical protein